jgi:hypothetical protein
MWWVRGVRRNVVEFSYRFEEYGSSETVIEWVSFDGEV